VAPQVTASVTFLPLLDEPAAFDLLAYTDADATVPVAWEDSDPRYIPTAAEVKLRTFDTSIHKVAPAVSFRAAGAAGEDV
jgi:mitotic spindle assembly checkpoint protein MAD2